MMRNRTLSTLILLLLLLGSTTPLRAATSVAEVVSVRGSATVVRSEDGSREDVERNDNMFLNDKVKTATNGRVKLLLRDDSVLKVSPGSELLLSEMVVGPGDESRATVNLLKGKLRSLVGKKLGANSRFEVHTSVAVAGVRGTDFEVLSAEQTWVRCYEGIVEVGNIDENVPGVVRLHANMFTRVGPDLPPSQPEYIAPGESIESRAGLDDEQAEAEKEGGDLDSLDDLEVEQIEDDDFGFSDIEDGMDEFFISQELLDEQLLGDVVDGQVETVVEQPELGSSVPIDITIPAP